MYTRTSSHRRLITLIVALMLVVFSTTAVWAQEATAEPPPVPTENVTAEPTSEPTAEPTTEPTAEPTTEPTAEPTPEVTTEPPTPPPPVENTPEPTPEPTETPAPPTLSITSPTAAQTLATTNGITITGTSTNLAGRSLDVSATSASGELLRRANVAVNADGTWSVRLNFFVTTNTAATLSATYANPDGDDPQASVVVNLLPNCTVNTTWEIYIVERGDTLSGIAQRTETTVTQLAAANCLNNVNLIEVGQQVRVPRLPQPPAPDATPAPTVSIAITAPLADGTLDVTQAALIQGTAQNLAGDDVLVQALNADGDVLASQSVQAISPAGSNTAAWQATLNINAPDGTRGRIVAFATDADGALVASAAVNVTFVRRAPRPETDAMIDLILNTDSLVAPDAPLTLRGNSANVPGNRVYVLLIDTLGNVLRSGETTIAPDGTWTLDLNMLDVPASIRATVYVYGRSALDAAPVAVDTAQIIIGPLTRDPFITLTEPLPYETIISDSTVVVGQVGNATNSVVLVQAVDAAGDVLAESVPLALDDSGNAGFWRLALDLSAVPVGTRGQLVATIQDVDRNILAEARRYVTFGNARSADPHVTIVSPLPAMPLRLNEFVIVSGYASETTGSITVQLYDAQNNILASQPAAILDDIGLWQVGFGLTTIMPNSDGSILALLTDAQTGAVIASDRLPVVFR